MSFNRLYYVAGRDSTWRRAWYQEEVEGSELSLDLNIAMFVLEIGKSRKAKLLKPCLYRKINKTGSDKEMLKELLLQELVS